MATLTFCKHHNLTRRFFKWPCYGRLNSTLSSRHADSHNGSNSQKLRSHSHCSQKQQTRTVFKLPNPFRRKQNFSPIDRVPADFQCVYNSPMNITLAYTYPVGAITSGLTVAAVTKILCFPEPNQVIAVKGVKAMYDNVFTTGQLVFGTVLMATLGICVWQLSIRSPLRIYYSPKEELFIASFPTLRPWRTSQLMFEPGDVVHKYPLDQKHDSFTLRIFLGEYIINNKRVVLFPEKFSQPYFYNLMLGLKITSDYGDTN